MKMLQKSNIETLVREVGNQPGEFTVTRFMRKKDPLGTEKHTTFSSYCDALEKPQIDIPKDHAPLLLAATFAPRRGGGHPHDRASLTTVTALTMDLERHKDSDGAHPPSAEVLAGQLRSLDFLRGAAFVIHPTASWRADAPRWRLVLPYTVPIPAEASTPEGVLNFEAEERFRRYVARELGWASFVDTTKLNGTAGMFWPTWRAGEDALKEYLSLLVREPGEGGFDLLSSPVFAQMKREITAEAEAEQLALEKALKPGGMRSKLVAGLSLGPVTSDMGDGGLVERLKACGILPPVAATLKRMGYRQVGQRWLAKRSQS
jgi:hypothetical protein